MLNEQLYPHPEDPARRLLIVGPPIFELSFFLHSLICNAADGHIDFDHDDDEARDKAHEAAWDLRLTKLELARLCAEAVDDMGALDCIWCGQDCTDEYYMVNDDLWDSHGPKNGCLCIGCLENRVGRRLVPSDFTDAPVNHEGCQSDRLLDRLGLIPTQA